MAKKPRFTPDPPPFGAPWREVVAWANRQVQRISDLWPDIEVLDAEYTFDGIPCELCEDDAGETVPPDFSTVVSRPYPLEDLATVGQQSITWKAGVLTFYPIPPEPGIVEYDYQECMEVTARVVGANIRDVLQRYDYSECMDISARVAEADIRNVFNNIELTDCMEVFATVAEADVSRNLIQTDYSDCMEVAARVVGADFYEP